MVWWCEVWHGLVRQVRYVVVLRGEVSYGELRIGMIGQASYG